MSKAKKRDQVLREARMKRWPKTGADITPELEAFEGKRRRDCWFFLDDVDRPVPPIKQAQIDKWLTKEPVFALENVRSALRGPVTDNPDEVEE